MLFLRFQLVRFFAVLSTVQAFHFMLLGDAEAGDQIGYFENHDGADKREAPGEEHTDQLVAHLAPIAIPRSDRFAVAKNRIDDSLRKEACEQGADRPARAMYA